MEIVHTFPLAWSWMLIDFVNKHQPVNQLFLFLLFLLPFVSVSGFDCEAKSFAPMAELHRDLSISDGVKESPFKLKSYIEREKKKKKKSLEQQYNIPRQKSIFSPLPCYICKF